MNGKQSNPAGPHAPDSPPFPGEAQGKLLSTAALGKLRIELREEGGEMFRFYFHGQYHADSFVELGKALATALDDIESHSTSSPAGCIECHYQGLQDLSSTVMGHLALWTYELRPKTQALRIVHRRHNAWERAFTSILRTIVKAPAVPGAGSIELVEVR